MAIDQDTAAKLRAQIERIRSEQFIPDPENEAEFAADAYPVKWGKSSTDDDKFSYACYVPLSDAMSPDFPKGSSMVFRYADRHSPDPQDGDIVLAALSVFGPPKECVVEHKELAMVIRRYRRLPDGRSRLTPLNDGFSSWTHDDLTQYGFLDVYVMGVAVPYDGILINSEGGKAVFIPKSAPATMTAVA
jgi:hypothetical protein